ncbi:hypothetical protein, partial [Vibrio cholerae]
RISMVASEGLNLCIVTPRHMNYNTVKISDFIANSLMSVHKKNALKMPIFTFVILLTLASERMNLFQENLIDKSTW